MKKILAIIILIIISATVSAQNQNTIDSLKIIINNKKAKDTILIQAYLKLSFEYKNINRYSALIYADLALNKSLKINYKKGIAEAYKRKGIIMTDLCDYKQADSLLKIAISIYKEINDQTEIMKCYVDIAVSAYYKGENILLLEYSQKALKIAEEKNFVENKAKLLNNIGIAYTNLGDYEKALDYEIKALKTFEELGKKKMITNCYINIGCLFIETKEFNKALEYLYKAINLSVELKDTQKQSICLTNLGDIYTRQNKYDEALQSYNKAVELDIKNNDLNGVLINYINIGRIYYDRGEYYTAKEYYNKSFEISKEIGNNNGIAAYYLNIAGVETKLKNYKLAEEYCLKSIKVFKHNKEIRKQQISLEQLAIIYYSAGKYQKAYDTYVDAVVINDSIFYIDKAKKIAQLEEKYLNEKKDKQIQSLEYENNIKTIKINHHKKIHIIYIIVLILTGALITIILIQYRKKNTAYKFLVKKNMDLLLKEKETKNNKEKLQNNYQNKISQNIISETEKEKILNKMTKLLDTDKIYNKFDLTCNKFAKQLSTNRSYLSQIINEKFGKNYSDFINEYRVKEVMLMLSDPIKTKQFSIETIAREAGFKNISSFNRIFKKFTGVTPSVFVNKR